MNPFTPIAGSTVILNATAVTSAAALLKMPSGLVQARLVNEGPNTAYISWGGGSFATAPVTATLTDYCLPAGAIEVISIPNTEFAPVTQFGAICPATGTARVTVSLGAGE